jgi:endoglucanase
MQRFNIVIMILAIFIFRVNATEANSTCDDPKIGINLAGPEFGGKHLPGKLGHDYLFPNAVHLIYYKAKGFNAVRLPIKWERLQQKLYSDLDTAYLNEIQNFLMKAKQYQMDVVLDLHNYGRYKGKIIGSQQVPKTAFYDLWKRTAHALKNYPALMAYGLMNEPHNTKGLWFQVAQSAVDGIRSEDKNKAIYIAGEHWSNAHMWSRVNPKPFVNDPANNIAYEAHLYFDKDFSGRYQNPEQIYNKEDVYKRIKSFVLWLKKYNLKGIIGEWGVPSDNPDWFPVVDEFTDLAKEHCLDWYYWRGGVWADNYPLSLEPVKAKDRPLMKFLSHKIKTELESPLNRIK